jgi:hypothetical protein
MDLLAGFNFCYDNVFVKGCNQKLGIVRNDNFATSVNRFNSLDRLEAKIKYLFKIASSMLCRQKVPSF